MDPVHFPSISAPKDNPAKIRNNAAASAQYFMQIPPLVFSAYIPTSTIQEEIWCQGISVFLT
jgi:hypothetical protein